MKRGAVVVGAMVMLLCCLQLGAQGPAAQNGDDISASGNLKHIRRAAENGDAVAQYYLAKRYAQGDGVGKDFGQAAKWYRMAAEQGNVESQNNLGLIYANGEGVTKDPYMAVVWYQKAANQGYATSQYNIGLMYEKGEGVERDEQQAIAWYRKAAVQGDAKAKSSLEEITKRQSQNSPLSNLAESLVVLFLQVVAGALFLFIFAPYFRSMRMNTKKKGGGSISRTRTIRQE